MMMPRVLVYSHEDVPLFELDPGMIIGLLRHEEVNGEHSLKITTLQELEKGQRIFIDDATSKLREWVVLGETASRLEGAAVQHEYYCVWSLQYDLSGAYITDRRVGTSNDMRPASEALSVLLSATDRWDVGFVGTSSEFYATFYYTTCWDGLSEVVKRWGGEVDATVTLSNMGEITRSLDFYAEQGEQTARRRFDYGGDLSGIKRTVEDGLFVCRVLPRGKGELVSGEAGTLEAGYGRRITIADVNGGVEYIEDSDAVPLVRLPDGAGGYEYPTALVVYEDIETPEELLAAARRDLQLYTRPRVSYEADVIQLHEAGMDSHGVELGDAVDIVDTTFGDGLRIEARVVMVEMELLDPTQTKLTIGNAQASLADSLKVLSDKVATVDDYLVRQGDATTAQWVDDLIKRINIELNALGGYTYLVPGMGCITYDVAVEDPSVGTEASSAVEIRGGSIRIADSKDAQGNWEWRTLILSGTINSQVITAAQITTGFIGSAGDTYIDLDSGSAQIGSSDGAHLLVEDGSLSIWSDDDRVAYVGEDGFHIPELAIDSSITFDGKWIWVQRDNGNLALKWIG